MNISGKTSIVVNGKITRVCGHHFNAVLKSNEVLDVKLETGESLIPSKGLSWLDVAKVIRSGKKVQASVTKHTGIVRPKLVSKS